MSTSRDAGPPPLAQSDTPHTAGAPPGDGPHITSADVPLSATITGDDGTDLATIIRHTEPGPTADDLRVIITVVGDVDAETTPLLRQLLMQTIDRQPDVWCDLGRATFLDAAGAGVLAAAHLHAVRAGRRFAVRGAAGYVRRVLRITGLEDLLCPPV